MIKIVVPDRGFARHREEISRQGYIDLGQIEPLFVEVLACRLSAMGD